MFKINNFSIAILALLVSLIFNSCGDSLTEIEKNSDAVFLNIEESYTLNGDRSVTYKYNHILQHNTTRSFSKFGEEFITYNPKYQTLSFDKEKCYTHTPENNKVVVPDNAYNIVLPSSCANDVQNLHQEEMIVTHTGLDVGAKVYFNYTLNTKRGFYPFFNERISLQKNVPIKKRVINISFQSTEGVDYKLLNIDGEPTIISEDGITTYTWEFNNIAAEQHEQFSKNVSQELYFTEKGGSYAFLKSSFRDKRIENDEHIRTLERFAMQSYYKSDNSLTRAFKIHKRVVNEINTYHTPLWLTKNKVNSPFTTLSRNGGNEADKALLLYKSFQIAEIESDIAVTLSSDILKQSKGVSNIYIVANIDGTVVWFSPISANAIAHSPSGSYYLINDVFKNIIDKKESSTSFVGEYKINSKNGIAGTSTYKCSGRANSYLRFKESKKYSKSLAPYTPYQTTEQHVTKESSLVNFKVFKPEVLSPFEDYFEYSIPSVKDGFSLLHISYLMPTRELDFVLPFTIDDSFDISIELPKKYALASKPVNVSLKNNVGEVVIKTSVNSENKLIIVRSIKIYNDVISVQDYSNFYELFSVWTNKNNKKIYLKLN